MYIILFLFYFNVNLNIKPYRQDRAPLGTRATGLPSCPTDGLSIDIVGCNLIDAHEMDYFIEAYYKL